MEPQTKAVADAAIIYHSGTVADILNAMTDLRQQLTAALADFATRPFAEAASALFGVLGYSSDRRLPIYGGGNGTQPKAGINIGPLKKYKDRWSIFDPGTLVPAEQPSIRLPTASTSTTVVSSYQSA